jgi:acyl carrier protein
MNQVPRAEDVVAMLREEGIVDLPVDFPVTGDLFAEGMDSMAVMQLIVVAEERFGAVIGPEDAGRENLATPAALAGLIARKSGGAA